MILGGVHTTVKVAATMMLMFVVTLWNVMVSGYQGILFLLSIYFPTSLFLYTVTVAAIGHGRLTVMVTV